MTESCAVVVATGLAQAVALSETIHVGDRAEYASPDDVRWFTRPQARAMLAAAR